MPTYGSQRGSLAIAHRGGVSLAAENTIDAFERSYGLGMRYFETDVRVSANGVAVAYHDATLARVHRQPGRLTDFTDAELRRLAIPRIDQLLSIFPDAQFVLDVKETAAMRPLISALWTTQAAERVCVAGAWDGWLNRLRSAVGAGLTTAVGWRALGALLGYASVGQVPPRWTSSGEFVHLPQAAIQSPGSARQIVAAAHAVGVRVVVWTVNDGAQMRRLLDAGVDGLITDQPDRLRELLIARQQWHHPNRPLVDAHAAAPGHASS